MERYSIWLRSIELLAVAVVLIFCVLKMHKKRFALYFKIFLCATACYLLFLLYDVITVICLSMQLAVDIGDIGVLGCGAFLFSANFGQMDGLVDEKKRNSCLIKWLSLLAPICLLAVFCLLTFSSNVSLSFKIFGIIPVLSGAIASYYHLKHILLPDDSLGLLKIVRPTNIFALSFLLFNTLFMGASIANYVIFKEIAGILSTLFICVMSGCLIKEAKKWKTSI